MPVDVTSPEAAAPRARERRVHRFPWWIVPSAAATAANLICTARALADGSQLVRERALFEIRPATCSAPTPATSQAAVPLT